MQDNYIRKLYVSAAVLFAAVIAVVMAVFLVIIPLIKDAARPAYLDVLVAPVDATVAINGENYNNAIYEMEPGHYVATISKDSFKSMTVEFDLKKGETTGLYAYLEPTNGDWAVYEQTKNQASLEALLRLNGYDGDAEVWRPEIKPAQEKEGAKKIAEKYKAKSILPMNLSLCGETATRMTCNAIKVEYKYAKKCGDKICLVISGRSKELPDEALSEIQSRFTQGGFEFGTYDYVYVQDSEM